MKSRLAVPDLCYLQPLIYGLEKPQSPFELVVDFPARNSIAMSERSSNLRGAFLSPLDYARHGAEYCIVPEIVVASKQPTETVLLFIKEGVHNITSIAVDIRFTSEIILAKIILLEKYRNLSGHSTIQYIPMMPDLNAMLAKADAALIVQSPPHLRMNEKVFALDLVEEWYDLTELPYIHGFWVGREEEMNELEAKALLQAQKEGMQLLPKIAEALALRYAQPIETMKLYLGAFTYQMTEEHEESLEEFFHYAFFHGALPDVPQIRFFDVPPDSDPQKN